MDRLEEFDRSHKEAIDDILEYIQTKPEMADLVQWLLDTELNPYSFMQDAYINSLYTSQGFSGLLAVIHHALFDDGDITFVKVNGSPRIVFAHRYDDNFRDVVLSASEKSDQIRKEPVIEILDCSANEFGQIAEDVHTADLKRCFAMDAARHGTEFAIEHYSSYTVFDESWVEECKNEITKWNNFYKKVADASNSIY